MPSWKKVIVSGSSPHFNEITASGNISGSSTSTGSFGLAQSEFVKHRVLKGWYNDNTIYDLPSGGDQGIRIAKPTPTSGNSSLPIQFTNYFVEIKRVNNNLRLGAYQGVVEIYDTLGTQNIATFGTSGLTFSMGNISGVANITATGNISGSATSTGSFGHLLVNGSVVATSPDATDGSQNTISGSITSTGSFGSLNTGQIIVSGSEKTSDIIQIYNDAGGAVGYAGITFDLDNSTNDAEAYLRLDRTSGTSFLGLTMQSDGRDGMRFMTGTTERLRIDGDVVSGSSTSTGSFGSGFFDGRVGIYQKTPTAELHISSPSSQPGIRVDGGYANIQLEGDNLAHISLKDEGATSGERVYQISSDGGILAFNRTNDAISSVTATPLKLKDDKVEVLNISGSITSTGSFGHVRMDGKDLPPIFTTGNSIYLGQGGTGTGDDGSANNNVGIGYDVLSDIGTGARNVAIGLSAMANRVSSSENVAIGYRAGGPGAQKMGQNTLVGVDAGYSLDGSGGTYNATSNTFIGHQAGDGATSGLKNTAVGDNSARSLVAGSSNVFLGYFSGNGGNTEGGTYIGQYASATDGATNEIVIGKSAVGKGSNTVVLGDDNITDIYMSEDVGAMVHVGNISGSITSTGSFGSFNNDFIPSTDNTHDLGSSDNRWANIHSADLHLSNENTNGNEVDGTTGNWTVQEGEDDLYLLNRKNGKKYKFKLEEVT